MPGLAALLVLWLLCAPLVSTAGGKQGGQSNQETNQFKFQPDAKKAKEAYRRGLLAEQKQDWTDAFIEYSDAVNFAPENHDYLLRREVARSHRVQEKMEQAEKDAASGRLVLAIQEMRDARTLDPTNTLIRDRITELSALLPVSSEPAPVSGEPAAPVHLEFQPGKKTFDIRGDVTNAYEEIARQFGVEAAFDVEIVPRQIRIHVESLDFLQAMDLVGTISGTFWRPLTRRLFFVSPDTPQKRKEFDASIVRTIHLPAADTSEQVTEIMRVVRDITGITRTEMDTRTATLTLRGSPRAMAIATGLIDDLEKSPGEVILEIEVLQVSRNYARDLGITPPQNAQVYTITPQQITEAEQSAAGLISVLEQIFGTPSSLSGLSTTQIGSLLSSGQLGAGTLIPPLVAFGGGMTTFLATLPGASADFSTMLSLVRTGQRIILRAEDGRAASFFVGDRIPVSLGQYSASLGGEGTNLAGVTSENFPTTTLTTGKGPESIATADLRTESRNDLIVANSGDATLSVFLSNGDGTFESAITPAPVTGTDPVWVTTGNFNNLGPGSDSFPDLAVADETANTVSILLGNGDGTFKPKVDLPTGRAPVSVVAANFHDTTNSNLDLAVANFNDNTISLFPGNGDGTFGTPTTLVTGLGPSAITTGDFNGDGHQDIAVADKNANTVSVFLGNGDGTFKKRIDYATGRAPVWVSTADLRGIGDLDLVVANNTDNTVSILLGNGNGSFAAQTTYAAGNAPTSIAIADYNVDGILDLAVTDANDNAVSLLLGLGDGTFSTNVELPVGTDPVSIVTADFNGDGLADAAIANFGSNDATVIINSSSFVPGGSTPGGAGTPFPGVEYIDVGVKVKATPRVHPDDDVSLQLSMEISSVTGSSFNSIPVIANQSVEQTVRVHEGQPSLLAGILQPQHSVGINGTPGLASVPVAGDVLSNTNVTDQDSELLILITPHIISEKPRTDHVIYAGRGGVEGRAGSVGLGTGLERPFNGGAPPRGLREEPRENPPEQPPVENPPAEQGPPAPAQPQPQPQNPTQPPPDQPQTQQPPPENPNSRPD